MTLDLLPAFLMAVLACWLGLSLLVRSPLDSPTRAFAWLCLHLTLYGLAIVLGRWTPSPSERDKVAAAFGLTREQIAWGHKTPIQHIYGSGPG